MGTQGGINYNLELVPRQVEYPMVLPPSEEAITPFVIHGMECRIGNTSRKSNMLGRTSSRKDMNGGLDVARLRPATKHGSEVGSNKLDVDEKLDPGSMESEYRTSKRKLEAAVEAQAAAQKETEQECHLNVEIGKKARTEKEDWLKAAT
ncbi:hypothetical protein CR513_20476, partial [Mucuna pruriens]